jgi:hypothetical protein
VSITPRLQRQQTHLLLQVCLGPSSEVRLLLLLLLLAQTQLVVLQPHQLAACGC